MKDWNDFVLILHLIGLRVMEIEDPAGVCHRAWHPGWRCSVSTAGAINRAINPRRFVDACVCVYVCVCVRCVCVCVRCVCVCVCVCSYPFSPYHGPVIMHMSCFHSAMRSHTRTWA
jgi:hypothetical protein